MQDLILSGRAARHQHKRQDQIERENHHQPHPLPRPAKIIKATAAMAEQEKH
ncbi:MAG: hypothetical protein MJH10_07260 [Epibacterium sp.]|nr:hypothetical protein [Epibacterium sp.]